MKRLINILINDHWCGHSWSWINEKCYKNLWAHSLCFFILTSQIWMRKVNKKNNLKCLSLDCFISQCKVVVPSLPPLYTNEGLGRTWHLDGWESSIGPCLVIFKNFKVSVEKMKCLWCCCAQDAAALAAPSEMCLNQDSQRSEFPSQQWPDCWKKIEQSCFGGLRITSGGQRSNSHRLFPVFISELLDFPSHVCVLKMLVLI